MFLIFILPILLNVFYIYAVSVGIESISVTPEIEFPDFAPPWPEELRSLVEEHHPGMYKIIISKMVERNKYDQVAILHTMENINPHGKPQALPEEICEVIMLVAQYDYERFDTYYKYRAEIISGGKGKARRQVSKHFELTADGEVSRTVNVMNEGELLEQQSNYIGELHSQMIGMAEVTQGMVKPLLTEFKEMVKVISDSQQRLGEIEARRQDYELQRLMYEDEKEIKKAEAERAHQRWLAFKETLDKSGVIPMAMAQLASFVKRKTEEQSGSQPSPEERITAMAPRGESIRSKNLVDDDERKQNSSKKKKKKNKENKYQSKVEDIVAERAAAYEDNPVLGSAAALKMSIDSLDQWKKIEEHLDPEQFDIFSEAISSNEESHVKESIRKLSQTNIENLVSLTQFMDDNQQFFVSELMRLSVE